MNRQTAAGEADVSLLCATFHRKASRYPVLTEARRSARVGACKTDDFTSFDDNWHARRAAAGGATAAT